nr:helix-turn-helix transcriptional regulator [Paenibacillus aceris]
MCLQFVADKLNLSAKQVSKTFNSQYARSVADYINDVRLEKATEWLQNSNLNMKDILQKIGLENESYFYKLFKKKYGVPPKEYVLNKQLKEIRKLE